MSQFLTLRQVTQQLGISERTVYRLMDSGELTPFKMGKSWRFDQPDVDDYIARLRQQAQVKRGRPRGTSEEARAVA